MKIKIERVHRATINGETMIDLTEEQIEDALDALIEIARGKPKNGLPLAGEECRQISRRVLVPLGIHWGQFGQCGKSS